MSHRTAPEAVTATELRAAYDRSHLARIGISFATAQRWKPMAFSMQQSALAHRQRAHPMAQPRLI